MTCQFKRISSQFYEKIDVLHNLNTNYVMLCCWRVRNEWVVCGAESALYVVWRQGRCRRASRPVLTVAFTLSWHTFYLNNLLLLGSRLIPDRTSIALRIFVFSSPHCYYWLYIIMLATILYLPGALGFKLFYCFVPIVFKSNLVLYYITP